MTTTRHQKKGRRELCFKGFMEQESLAAPPPLLVGKELQTWTLRGSKYTHDGECFGEACNFCYKYSCADCGQRSNRVMTCGFCIRSGKVPSMKQ